MLTWWLPGCIGILTILNVIRLKGIINVPVSIYTLLHLTYTLITLFLKTGKDDLLTTITLGSVI